MRILTVGDSMTIGSAGDFTWRYRMWQHLVSTYPAPFHLVGPRTALHEGSTAYAAGDFPEDARRHLSGWGEGWVHLAPVVGDTVQGHGADTVLVSLGLIDLGFYTDAEQTTVHVHRFLDEIRAADPRIRLVALPVLPNIRARHDAAFAAECEKFNALLARILEDRSTPASPLLLAPAPADWSTEEDTYDGTHPSPRGEHRMAAAFAGTLHHAWNLGGPYTGAELAARAPV